MTAIAAIATMTTAAPAIHPTAELRSCGAGVGFGSGLDIGSYPLLHPDRTATPATRPRFRPGSSASEDQRRPGVEADAAHHMKVAGKVRGANIALLAAEEAGDDHHAARGQGA